MSENQPAQRRRRTDTYFENQSVPPQTPSALNQPQPVHPQADPGRERITGNHKTLRDAPVFPQKPPEKKERSMTPASAATARSEQKTRLRDATKPTPKMAPQNTASGKKVPQGTVPKQRVGNTGYTPKPPQAAGSYQPYPAQPSGVYVQQPNAYQGYPAQPSGYRQQPPAVGGLQPGIANPIYPGKPVSTGYTTTGYRPPYPQTGQQPVYQPYHQPDNGLGRSGYIPPVAPPPPPPQGSGKPPRKPSSFRLPRWLILSVIVVVLIGLGVTIISGIRSQRARQAFEASVHAYDNLYCEGVYVDGIHLGGMTQAEAADKVISHAQQENSSWSVRLTYQGETMAEITAGDLNITFDVNDALSEAWNQGHVGTVDERSEAMTALKATPFNAYTAAPSTDTSGIDSILTGLRTRFYQVPQNAYLLSFTPGATDPFAIQPEVPGSTLDIEPIRDQLYSMVSTMTGGEIELKPVSIQPDITTSTVRSTVALRGTAFTEISTTSTDNRNNNIRRAFEEISGTILNPGKSFSFNSIVGERTTANGFYEAPEIVYSEMTTGIGGGVCQASTTIYQAAVRAGMTITERTPHSEKANYCDYGMDATVYWYSNHRKDLKFTNSTDYPVYIVCSVQSNPNNRKRLICKVDIYGISLGNTSYELVNELVEELPFETETRRDKNQKYVLYTNEETVVQEGYDGFIYNTYRIKLENGVEVERVKLFTDEYKAKNKIIYVGTLNPPE